MVDLDPKFGIKLEVIFEHDGSGITGMVQAPGDKKHFYLVEQKGRIFKYDRETGQGTVFLDLTFEVEDLYRNKPMKVKFPDERGVLSLAFHPEYYTVGSLFYGVFIVIHSELADPKVYRKEYQDRMMDEVPNPDHMTCITQYRYSHGNTPEQTKSSRHNILCVPEPQANHNGGGLLFGPDGYLWIGLGDGGGANDEHGELLDARFPDSYLGNAQNLKSLHGKILRIEVVQPMPQGVPYLIPSDNPCAKKSPDMKEGGCYPEIAALGFRNPWRMSFAENGDLHVGNVGQNRHESIVTVRGLGGNYLWRGYEGNEVFNNTVATFIKGAYSKDKSFFPTITYGRELGIAIVGVNQYQGTNMPELRDKFVIADHSGRILLAYHDGKEYVIGSLLKMNVQFYSLANDLDGELYVMAFDPRTKKASIHLISAGLPTGPTGGTMSPVNVDPMSKYTEYASQIVSQAVEKANRVQSGLRVDQNGRYTFTKMHIAIIWRGQEKANLYHSMDDTWSGSMDISKAKAHTAMAFSSNENALTTRTIGILSQSKQPLWQIGNSNKEGGIIEFPGGVPLYIDGKLIGAVGVSGDHPDQDETVARGGAFGFEAPERIRSSTVIGVDYYGDLAAELGTTPGMPMKDIVITDREDWDALKKKNPNEVGRIKMFISGDRTITDLGEFIPFAKNFVMMNFFHTRLQSLKGIEFFTNLKA